MGMGKRVKRVRRDKRGMGARSEVEIQRSEARNPIIGSEKTG